MNGQAVLWGSDVSEKCQSTDTVVTPLEPTAVQTANISADSFLYNIALLSYAPDCTAGEMHCRGRQHGKWRNMFLMIYKLLISHRIEIRLSVSCLDKPRPDQCFSLLSLTNLFKSKGHLGGCYMKAYLCLLCVLLECFHDLQSITNMMSEALQSWHLSLQKSCITDTMTNLGREGHRQFEDIWCHRHYNGNQQNAENIKIFHKHQAPMAVYRSE